MVSDLNSSSSTDGLHTPLCKWLGCRYPILLAGMGGVSRHRLAAAVANAGGFGKLGMVREPVELVRAEVTALRQLSDKPFAVNLIPAATQPELLKAQVRTCLELRVPFMELFWDVDVDLIKHLKAEGVGVLHQVGNLRDAEAAVSAGADVLIAQGVEAGGHVRGTRAGNTLVAELVNWFELPVVASGGIASGEGLAAALALGAQGVNIGTAFIATEESNAHPHHQQRIVAANGDEPLYNRWFWRNWHEPAPVRVLPNRVTRGELGHYDPKAPPREIGQQDGQPVYLFGTDSPLAGATGDLDDMALYAGQGCGLIESVVPARLRLQQLVEAAQLATHSKC
jgi:nitronate monooxygenase